MAKTDYAMYQRSFLNTEEHGGTAFVEAIVPYASAYGSKGEKSVDASLKIADCNRHIEIDFSVYTKEQGDNARQKIARLRRAVVAFEAALLVQLKEAGTS